MVIYLDESGSITQSDGDYFIVGSFTVDDPRRISKAFRRWQKNKFPKKLKGQTEVKFSNSSLNDKLRLSILKLLVKEDIRIFYTFLKKKNVPKKYMKKGRIYETGLLYTEIVASTIELYLPLSDRELHVIRDVRTLKGVTIEMFEEILTARLLPKLSSKVFFRTQAVDSTTNVNVQIADWVCGALARYHEGKVRGEEFFSVLKNNIDQQKELFI